MAKLNLNKMSNSDAVKEVKRFAKNRHKSGQDPYTTTYNVCRKYIVTAKRAEAILAVIKTDGSKIANYIDPLYLIPRN